MRKTITLSRVFCLLATCLLLTVSVWSKQLSPVSKAEKAQTEQSSKQGDEPQSTVSELSPMATVAPVAIELAQCVFLLPAAIAIFSFEKRQCISAFAKPPFLRASYFENLFEHHIAPNAP